ncbi:MAG: class I SAM-dependent methyltransferase [Planctomycetes bacterium]|nr:class I SAM-dependent methyltransferase [Planctomycetota bacterium]
MSDYAYPGQELELFARAVNWKRYLRSRVGRFITGSVLEVGAGLGTTTRMLCQVRPRSWTCLEPDDHLACELREMLQRDPVDLPVRVIPGTIACLAENDRFDTIVYVDVLEHIRLDAEELQQASRHLSPGGCLLVVAPAHQSLFSPFDAAIGHFRRYDHHGLVALTPAGLRVESLFYLDSIGYLASFANRWFLNRNMPTLGQIMVWDRVFVRASRLCDRLFGYRVGKTVVGVWRNDLQAE